MNFSYTTLIWCTILAFGVQCWYISYRLPHEKAFRHLGLALLWLALGLLPEGQALPQFKLLDKTVFGFCLAAVCHIIASLYVLRFIFDVTLKYKKRPFVQIQKLGLALIAGLAIYALAQHTQSIFLHVVVAIYFLITFVIGLFSFIEYLFNSDSKNKPFFSLLLFGYILFNLSIIAKIFCYRTIEVDPQLSLKGIGFFAVLGTAFLMQRFLSVYRANKKTLDDLAFAYDKLGESARLKEIGVATSEITHEIRNYAATIKGNATLVGMKSSTHTKQAEAQKIKSTAERMEKISMDVALFARTSTALNKSPLILDAVLTKIINLWFKPFAHLFKISFDIPVPTLLADEEKITQVFINLFRNAIEAEAKSIQIRIKAFESKLILIVEDDGIGCDPENISQISKPFFSTKGAAGTGLGCSIALSILKARGATLRCYAKNGLSENTTGLIFNLVFPLSELELRLNSNPHIKIFCVQPKIKLEVSQPVLNLGILPHDLNTQELVAPSRKDAAHWLVLTDPFSFAENVDKLKKYKCIIVDHHRIGITENIHAQSKTRPFVFSEEKLVDLINAEVSL